MTGGYDYEPDKGKEESVRAFAVTNQLFSENDLMSDAKIFPFLVTHKYNLHRN